MPERSNPQLAAALEELGDLYELDGVDQFRVNSYRNAARSIRDATQSVAALVREGRATELKGVGKTLDEKLRALLETGDIPAAIKLREKIPVGLVSVMHLPGFGPKRARRLYDELGIDSLEALEAAAEAGEIRKLRGFGQKVETTLLEVLAAGHDGTPQPRVLLTRALPLAEQIVAALAELPIIAEAGTPGDNALRALTHTGMKVDVRVVEPDQFGNVLQHFTGSKAHNVALREAAVRRGLHV